MILYNKTPNKKYVCRQFLMPCYQLQRYELDVVGGTVNNYYFCSKPNKIRRAFILDIVRVTPTYKSNLKNNACFNKL